MLVVLRKCQHRPWSRAQSGSAPLGREPSVLDASRKVAINKKRCPMVNATSMRRVESREF